MPKHGSSTVCVPKFKNGGSVQMAAKGDRATGRDFGEDNDDEWESVGERWLTGKPIPGKPGQEEIGTTVDPGELDATAAPDASGRLRYQGKGWQELRTKDSEGGRRREYYKRKQGFPTS